ncbi:pentapeptide repeat-containing protein [Thalassotalea sp. G2M2-11]|uniref:pentapeptide repeat-containing protein n=1 Tax=Thalassotalea sp. G2M2-11 TaxID=2787627 RepID=UPI003216C91E
MDKTSRLCQYDDPEGIKCTEESGRHSHYCYWHDTSVDKSGEEVKEALLEYTRSGGMTRGICLKGANLKNIDLVNHYHKQGFDFSYTDFYRADLSGAHLFNINLTQASLMKCDLRYANLNCANLTMANLLGVKWKGCKIEHLMIGKKLIQEQKARQLVKENNKHAALDYFEQAEEIYRDLRKHAEHEGIFSMSGRLIQRELTMRRLQMPQMSFRRFSSKVVDLFCGYGEDPVRIVGISLILITLCAALYTITGLSYQGQVLAWDSANSLKENITLFFSCL